MEKGRYMTATALRLYKEKIIRDYRSIHEANKPKPNVLSHILKGLRTLVPLNIAVGIVASIILVYLKGWDNLLQVFLTSIIWITLTSTIIGAFLGKK